MNSSELHEKYAPIMHFSGEERFFPMAVEDFLAYAALYRQGEDAPLVSRGRVQPIHLRRSHAQDTFLCSLGGGPMSGVDVARHWGTDTIKLLYRWSRSPIYTWSETAARRAYDWFSEKTKLATKYFWWNKLLLRDDQAASPHGQRSELPRFRLPHDVRDAALENYDHSQGRRRNTAYYYRTVQQGDYLNLQYWFFYGYNDWANSFNGFNDHEGDWEGVQLFFKLDASRRPIEPPAYICYLGHHSRITKPWHHPDIQKTGTHPHVYVAAGSHASYPESKPYIIMSLYNLIDYATGDALTVDHAEWRRRINLDEASWVHSYAGSWGTRYWLPLAWLQKSVGMVVAAIPGEIQLPGVSAPRSPRFDDEGQERETWANAAAFAGLVES